MTTDAEIRKLMHAELKACHEDFEAMRTRAEAAEAALAERYKPCVWTYKRYGGWFATCQVRPASNSVSWKFCPYCGHSIEVAYEVAE